MPEGLTPRDIIDFFKEVNDIKITEKEFLKLVKIINMQDFMDRQAHSLSGGECQKLNILLATIGKPELLILDEVSTSLDITTKNDILNYFIEEYNSSDLTMINISHDEKEIVTLNKRFVFIHLGEIIYDKPIKEVIKEFESISNSFLLIPKKYYKKIEKIDI